MQTAADSRADGWRVEHLGRVESTQGLARGRPPWSALVAREQAAGRGQADRSFASDPGGLYLTAVLPYSGDPLETRGFALAVGWALRAALLQSGVKRLRLRWPNDLMVDTRKVGGILVEQGGPDTLLVGVGLNVTNRPWLIDPTLAETAGRLVDATDGGALPELAELAGVVLAAVREAHEVFAQQHLAGLVATLNQCWGAPRTVAIEPASGVTLAAARGRFQGIDASGHLLIETGAGVVVPVPAHHVGRLRELA